MAIKVKKITTNIQLDEDLDREIRAHHLHRKGDYSNLVNEAIREYLAKAEALKEQLKALP